MAASAVSVVLGKLADPIIQAAVSLYGVRGDVERLMLDIRWMQSFLKDAEAKRRRDGSELINNWVRDVKEVAQEAEDIIDHFMAAIESRRRQRSTEGFMGSILRYASLPFELKSRHKIGAGIKQLREKIQQIKTNKETYGLVNLGEATTSRPMGEALHASRRIAPHLDNDDAVLVGFDAHKEVIIGKLLDADIKRLCVVSIVGTGGIGKTTLATKIYRNSKIKICFDIHVCVSVSQVHTYDDMLRRIAKQAMGTNSGNKLLSMEMDALEGDLHEFLKEKRYLMILDDVWSRDVWDRMCKVLPDVKNGSRVLVTTRNMEVATSADPLIRPYIIPILDDKHSWELFLKKSFPENQDLETPSCPKELEEVGRKLVKRCGGLPLALVLLGGLLSRKNRNRAEWVKLPNWISTKDGKKCTDILALSYHDLPHHHLKSCFLYLAVFPEDWEIRETEVINLWVAEGLIPEDSTRTMEETARSYLNELAERSMIQLNYELWNPIPIYKIHDLCRDFCINEARDDGFLSFYCPNSPSGEMRYDSNSCRRLALHDVSANEVIGRPPASNLRSLLAFRTELGKMKIVKELKLLRVVHLESITWSDKLWGVSELGGAIHLRYICLRAAYQKLKRMSSMDSFSNLQTLDVSGVRIESLPSSIGKIKTLRHLYLPPWCECSPEICKLTNLKTLTRPSARGGWIENGLEKLVNVEALGVSRLGDRQTQIFFHSVGKMKRLKFLKINTAVTISTDSFKSLSNHDELVWMILDGKILGQRLVFPPNLTTLKLERCELSNDPMPVLEQLPHLTSLQLGKDSYSGGVMICTAGGFPSLQELGFRYLNRLEDWRVECEAMPKLKRLHMDNCRNLVMLPEGLQHLTSLNHLEVNLTSYTRVVREAADKERSDKFCRRLQREVGKDWYKIQHVPTIIIRQFSGNNRWAASVV